MKFYLPYLFVTSCLLSILGCGGGSAAGGDNFPSTLPTSPTAGFDTSKFFIGVRNSTEIRSHTRTAGSFGTECEIEDASASTDLVCYIDVPEGDLYFRGIDMVYSVPAGMCRYLNRSTYWFYNEEIGYGPTSLVIESNVNDANVLTSVQCNVDGAGLGSCNDDEDEVDFTVEGTEVTPVCVYDKTKSGFSNCCLGEYNITRIVNTTDGMGVTTTTTSTERLSWDSGDQPVKACLGGAARTNWDVFTSDLGYPANLITYADDGVSDTYKLKSPIESPNNLTNFPIANFYSPAPKHTHGDLSPLTTLTSDLPYFIDPIDDRGHPTVPGSFTRLVPGNDAYTFSCLDEAFETLHRIRVYVRDWDTYADYLAYIASSGVTSVPDRTGLEGVGCTEGIFGPCNDALDLDNFVENLSGAYFSAPEDRAGNFPFHEY